MADNITIPATGSGTAAPVVATDDVAGVHHQIVKLADGTLGSTALIGGDATNGLDVDVTRVIPGTSATHLGKAEDAGHSSGDTGVMALAVRNATATDLSAGNSDGDYEPLQVDANGRLHVINSAGVGGTVAHDSADAGNPVSTGLNARTTNPTAVTDGDRVRAIADDLGRAVVVLSQVRDLVGHQATSLADGNETTIVTAAASTFHDLTSLTFTSATGTDVTVTLRDDTGGTAVAVFFLEAKKSLTIPFGVPLKQAVVNKNWTAQLSAGSITVHVLAQYVKNV